MSRFLASLFALSLVLGPVSAIPTLNELDPRQTRTKCSDVFHLMVAAGCRQPCAADTPGKLGSLLHEIREEFPGSHHYFVPYNNSTEQAREATPVMIDAVNEYVVSCPNTPIIFLGYSLGGIVIMNTLCGGISANYTNQVIAAAVYGEETFTYPETYDRGTCKSNAPLYARNDTYTCDTYAPILHSYCDERDPQCCATGTHQQAHYAYPSKYNSDVVSYFSRQYSSYMLEPTPTPTAAPKLRFG